MTWRTAEQLRERARSIEHLPEFAHHQDHALRLRDTSCASVFILECAECTRSTRFICFVERHRGTYDLYGMGRDRETEQDNLKHERAEARRTIKTENFSNSVLTEADVRAIRRHTIRPGLYTELARTYRVNRNTIRFILERRTWRHI